ncbi:MAG TPA: phosphoribosylaminoimidazolesuccinocarboxamide synthase [Pirellulaceae bacterium]|nr:phosphoribosylaminoimidazolesuccinocarboxamide synthase [Pirellulaceae bacterium]HMO91886.1 phosphoribosylaminoimidazolesuccinocarboxamide synthase [Pirellulaceae bacterium]HMP69704.1 phosphoribosylaminoimidazolesuccinocarboxamide synthase [Pirellulaceae bacterium]
MTVQVRQGKVRDVYDLGDRLLMVASDRISAFDWVLPTLIPDKGRVLTQLSLFWFDLLDVDHHLISTTVRPEDNPTGLSADFLDGRSMIVRKCEVVPFECVVRGYLVGSGWKDYQATGEVCGISLPAGLKNCSKFPEPIFTPATKAESGHDENISFDFMANAIGHETAQWLKDQSIKVYQTAAEHAAKRGIILADTKFEWGWHDGKLLLIDEVLTPDSSRFWPADDYQEGRNQVSYDKQFVREFLETTNWDKNSPPPELPHDVVEKTREKYVMAYERLTEKKFDW